MAQKALARVLVVCGHFERGQHFAHRDYDFIGELVLDLTAVHADDVVSAALVNARDDFAAAVGVKRRLHLVAVVVGAFHADYRLDPAEAFQKLYHFILFVF